MKKYSRSLALLLGIFILITAAACSAGGGSETSDLGNTDTRTPETTDITATVTTEDPSVTVSGTPETSETVITTDTTEDVTTAPPHADDTLRIMMQKDRGEALTSLFADEESKTMLDERSSRLLREHSLALAIYQTDDIVSKVQNDSLTANTEYDLLLLMPDSGIELLTGGLLEALSEAGIGINAETAGIRGSITESLTVGGAAYLLACDALVSDLTSAYALRYDGTRLSSDPVTMASSGKFTAELMLTYISELGDSAFALDDSMNIALYTAVGGSVFIKDEKELPLSALASEPTFSEKYTAASELAVKGSDSEKGVFTVSKLTAAKENEIFLPLPKLSTDSEYSTLLDASSVSLLASPAGVVDGHRLASLISAFNMSSSDYREGIRDRLAEKSGARGKIMLHIIETSARLDLGILLGWGDIDALISEGIKARTDAEALLSDRVTDMRNKAVETAANIIADRLGIK